MDIPKVVPLAAPLKLVTMTIDMSLGRYLNLDVIARHVSLSTDSSIGLAGARFRDIRRGNFKEATTPEPDSCSRTSSSSGRFKNQCTFIVNIGEKTINTKVFNNGEIVNVGCKSTTHATDVASIFADAIHGLRGHVTYDVPEQFRNKNLKSITRTSCIANMPG